jgi:hypothetical protein
MFDCSAITVHPLVRPLPNVTGQILAVVSSHATFHAAPVSSSEVGAYHRDHISTESLNTPCYLFYHFIWEAPDISNEVLYLEKEKYWTKYIQYLYSSRQRSHGHL